METDDHDLVTAFRSGDNQAFTELYERYIRRIYDFVYYKTHHRETAEDIASQTFLQAFERIEGFDPTRGTFSAWIYRIARNLVIDHYRSARPSASIEDAWDIAGTDDVMRDADTALKVEKVREFLGTLPSVQRDIVLLRLWQDLPFAEIASIVGKTEPACKMAYKRATQKLRKEALFALFIFLLS